MLSSLGRDLSAFAFHMPTNGSLSGSGREGGAWVNDRGGKLISSMKVAPIAVLIMGVESKRLSSEKR